jgi:CHAT domain-containing protein/tetratricopeptide (TPR) repeat protein
LLLFFSGDEKQTWREKYEQKDSLALYLEKLYELTDDDAFYYSNKTDSLLQTLWRQPKNEREQIAYLDFLLNTAYHLLQQGQVQASTKRYEQGLRYQQQHKLTYETEEYIIKPLGNNYVRVGDYDKAIALQQQAINTAQQADKKELLASLYSNVAITNFWLGNYKDVQQQCNKALQFVEFNKTVTGLLYNVKADAFYADERKDSAFFYNQKALEFFRSPDAYEADAAWIVSALQLASKLLRDKKQYAEAVKKLQNAEQLLNQSFPETRQRDKAKLKVEKGNLFLLLNITDSAAANFQQGLQCFNMSADCFPDNTVTALYHGLAKTFSKSNVDSSLHFYQLALENDYYTNQLVTTSANSLQSRLDNEALSSEAIAYFSKHSSQLKTDYQLLWLMELSKARKLLNEVNRSSQWQQDSLQQQTVSLFAELRNDYLLMAETNDAKRKAAISQRIREKELELGLKENRFEQLLQQPSFEKFEQRMEQLKAKASIVSYYFTQDSLIIFKIADGIVELRVMERTNIESKISIFVFNYFSPSSTAFNNNPIVYFQESHQLFELLTRLDSDQPIIFSADGLLHRLPFEALCVNNTGTFLAETSAVGYVYSLLQYENKEKNSNEPIGISAYSFNSAHLGFTALPNSVNEVKALQKKYKTTIADAVTENEEQFLKAVQRSSVLHIASHAVADSIEQPYLVLNKKLYLGQLQYSLIASPLVVLTACETAAGKLQQGEGVVSLARAFLSKGVHGVVSSRWKVDDVVAPVIVEKFYQSLSQQLSPVTALHEARKQYLQNAKSIAQKNPLLWSGFCYVGVEQNIQLETSSSFEWYWLLLLLIPVGYWWWMRK